MPVVFGSVGDIISVSLLIKDVLKALSSTRGSPADYQGVVNELYVLDTALLQVEQLARTNPPNPQLEALWVTAQQTVGKCLGSLNNFKDGIQKYNSSLSNGGSRNVFKDVGRRLQWEFQQKERVSKFRAELMSYSHSIEMLLATISV